MPNYEYECATDGPFELYRPMSESSEDAQCPACGQMSARVICAPNVRLVSFTNRFAMDRNEKSRHAPHVCGTGCGHKHPKRKAETTESGKPKLQAYKGPRPWVIEHK